MKHIKQATFASPAMAVAPSKAKALRSALAAAVLALAAGTQVLAAGVTPVGEVSLVLGKAWIEHSGGNRELVKVGTAILPSDRIETATNGHVHIRFVDAALVSVRPSSTLEIVRYDYDPQSPATSAIKLNLLDGVTRAISGEAAKEARQNFRMNTPIAAIGVRGTDFVVSASQSSVRALVNEGAIIVAPYSSQCLVDALGPCSQNGLELAGGIGQLVQINANAGDPVLLPLALEGWPTEVIRSQAMVATERDEASEGELYAETVTARAVNPRIAARALRGPVYNPEAAVASQTLTNRQLVWGRWSEGDLRNERITISYANAVATGKNGTVGDNRYALFRDEPGGNQLVQYGLGVLGFKLGQAQANYRADGVSSLMDVTGGTLSLDFNQSLYATTLQLNHSATGNISLTDGGRIYSGGYFHNRTPTQVTAGAVSLDGSEAGYFFEKILEQGSIDGLTLWTRQP